MDFYLKIFIERILIKVFTFQKAITLAMNNILDSTKNHLVATIPSTQNTQNSILTKLCKLFNFIISGNCTGIT